MNAPRCVVIGLGGYGLVHIDAVSWLETQGKAVLAGVVALEADRKARPERVQQLQARGVRLYADIEEFFADPGGADVLTVPLGIHLHVPLTIRALKKNLHVYCEKPLTGTLQEADALVGAAATSDRIVTIGYQHVFSNSMRLLKERIAGGRLGPVRALTFACGWPRSEQYFARNEWTGRLRVGESWILDSPANNANAHYLMNALLLCGRDAEGAAAPAKVRAELYRANPIESADTTQILVETDSGAAIHAIFTHANGFPNGPIMKMYCEHGRVYWQTDNGLTYVIYDDGSHEQFDNLTHPRWRFDGFTNFVAAVGGSESNLCPPSLARLQTQTINLMHESCPGILSIDERHITAAEDWEMFPPDTRGMFRRVSGIDGAMNIALAEGRTFSDLGFAWTGSMESAWVDAASLSSFPGPRFAAVHAGG